MFSNPLEIAKVLRLRLSNSTAYLTFRNVMQQLLLLSSNEDPGHEKYWEQLEKLVSKVVQTGIVSETDMMSKSELKLQDKIMAQQKQIADLEAKLKQGRSTDQHSNEEDKKTIELLRKRIASLEEQLKNRNDEEEKKNETSIVDNSIQQQPNSEDQQVPPITTTGEDIPPPPPPIPGTIPPPPPPGKLGGNIQVNLPKLPTYKPSQPTRNFYCDPISKIKVGNTIWIKGGIAEKVSEIKLDTENLAQLFSSTSKSHKGNESNDNSTHKPKPKVVTFIDSQKGGNVALLLGYLKLDIEVIRDAIIKLDDTILSQQNIAALKDKCPTPDEVFIIFIK